MLTHPLNIEQQWLLHAIHFQSCRSNTYKDNLGQSPSSSCGARLVQPILTPTADLHGHGRTLAIQSFQKQNKVGIQIVCQKLQADCSKGNSKTNLVLKGFLEQFTSNISLI